MRCRFGRQSRHCRCVHDARPAERHAAQGFFAIPKGRSRRACVRRQATAAGRRSRSAPCCSAYKRKARTRLRPQLSPSRLVRACVHRPERQSGTAGVVATARGPHCRGTGASALCARAVARAEPADSCEQPAPPCGCTFDGAAGSRPAIRSAAGAPYPCAARRVIPAPPLLHRVVSAAARAP